MLGTPYLTHFKLKVNLLNQDKDKVLQLVIDNYLDYFQKSG